MDVITRIEELIAATIDVIGSGSLPVFRFRSRSSATHRSQSSENEIAIVEGEDFDGDGDVSIDEIEERSIDTTLNDQQRFHSRTPPPNLSDAVIERDLISRNGAGAFHIARVLKVLDVVHELLTESNRCTQRELYYRLQQPPLFTTVSDVTEALHDVCCMLDVPRSALNISCSPKGAVSGHIHIKHPRHPFWQDGTQVGSAGWSIPGDAVEIEQLQMQCHVPYLIIIEKDAVFQRLTDDRFFDILPCVLVTGKGMPDFGTRLFLHRLIRASPHLTVLGIVDWNPSGVAILNIYRHGSARMGPYTHSVRLPQLRWLGLRTHLLPPSPSEAFFPLTPRDGSLILTLKSQLSHLPDWIHELNTMERTRLKCDIEAVYHLCGFKGLIDLLSYQILHGQY